MFINCYIGDPFQRGNVYHFLGDEALWWPSLLQEAITQALRNAAVALQKEIAAHKNYKRTTTSKHYERDSKRAVKTLKHLHLYQLYKQSKLDGKALRHLFVAARVRLHGAMDS